MFKLVGNLILKILNVIQIFVVKNMEMHVKPVRIKMFGDISMVIVNKFQRLLDKILTRKNVMKKSLRNVMLPPQKHVESTPPVLMMVYVLKNSRMNVELVMIKML